MRVSTCLSVGWRVALHAPAFVGILFLVGCQQHTLVRGPTEMSSGHPGPLFLDLDSEAVDKLSKADDAARMLVVSPDLILLLAGIPRGALDHASDPEPLKNETEPRLTAR